LFRSFFLGGFECSTHSRTDGTRLDLIASTGHDRFVEQDYRRLISRGIYACRDGLRWHLIERRSGHYDFSSFRPMLDAARRTGMQVLWDVCHYGWPDGLDVFSPRFINRFAAFARAAARVVISETNDTPWFSPLNEISFFSWAGGQKGILPPFARGRGSELKAQLVRATIAAIEAIRDVAPHARFVQVDPIIHIVTDPEMPAAMVSEAHAYCRAQFQAWDMLAGYVRHELGGDLRYLDVIGGNYYVHNQWVYGGKFIERTDPRYRPLSEMIGEVSRRYHRPFLLAETGIEDERRPEWLRYITNEIVVSLRAGLPVEGICLYPILNHPGWVDDRHCRNGLWDYCNDCGERAIYIPLEDELVRQQIRINHILTALRREPESLDVVA
jgi:hypothetical protein